MNRDAGSKRMAPQYSLRRDALLQAGASLLSVVGILYAFGCSPGGSGPPDDPNDPNGTTDPNTPGPTTLTIVKTSIPIHSQGGLKCGDDLIAYGYDSGGSAIVGVSYVIPSTSPTAGTAVTNSYLYDNGDFAIGGKTIFLVGTNGDPNVAFQVHVYDVPSASITKTFTTGEIRLKNIPVSPDDIGNIQADGDYCVVICDQNIVTDGKIIKVIDVGSGTPTLVPLVHNPATSAWSVEQVAVDAATNTVVAVADDTFYVYDILSPDDAPAEIPAPNGIGARQISISGTYVIAQDDEAYEHAFLVDLATSTVISLTDAFATGEIDIGGDVFAFFSDSDAADSVGGWQRAAVGTVPGPGYTKAPTGNQIDGYTNNNGLVGFAADLCVVPDGSYVFLSGSALQYSPGNATFTCPPDAGGMDPYVTPAWNIDASINTVGFKTALTRTTATKTIGYIILP